MFIPEPPDETEPDGFDRSQICQSGHVINSKTQKYPEHSREYCQKCGGKGITNCDKCEADIIGEFHNSSGGYKTPQFCHGCGAIYPWTRTNLEFAQAMVEEIQGLETNDKLVLQASLGDIVADTPKGKLGALRIAKLWGKLQGPAGDIVKATATEIASKGASAVLKALVAAAL